MSLPSPKSSPIVVGRKKSNHGRLGNRLRRTRKAIGNFRSAHPSVPRPKSMQGGRIASIESGGGFFKLPSASREAGFRAFRGRLRLGATPRNPYNPRHTWKDIAPQPSLHLRVLSALRVRHLPHAENAEYAEPINETFQQSNNPNNRTIQMSTDSE